MGSDRILHPLRSAASPSKFTPPSHGTKIYYNATLNVPVPAGANQGTTTVSLWGCDANVAAGAGMVTGITACYQGVGGTDAQIATEPEHRVRRRLLPPAPSSTPSSVGWRGIIESWWSLC